MKRKMLKMMFGDRIPVPLEKEEHWSGGITKDGRTILKIKNEALGWLKDKETTIVSINLVKGDWDKKNDIWLSAEKIVRVKGDTVFIVFDKDTTALIFKNFKITSIWAGVEFDKKALYIFTRGKPYRAGGSPPAFWFP